MSNPPVLSIKMVPAGVDLVIAGLTKLPYEQVADLIAEIRGQAVYQIEELQNTDIEVVDAGPDDAEVTN